MLRQLDTRLQRAAAPERCGRRARAHTDSAGHAQRRIHHRLLKVGAAVAARGHAHRAVGAIEGATFTTVAVVQIDDGNHRALARQPGQRQQQQRRGAEQRPHGDAGVLVEQRVQEQIEPIETHHRRYRVEVRRPLAEGGVYEGQYDERRQRADGKAAGRVDPGMGVTVDVDPHDEQQNQRHGDVDEDHEREESPAQGGIVNEVARDRLPEQR